MYHTHKYIYNADYLDIYFHTDEICFYQMLYIYIYICMCIEVYKSPKCVRYGENAKYIKKNFINYFIKSICGPNSASYLGYKGAKRASG